MLHGPSFGAEVDMVGLQSIGIIDQIKLQSEVTSSRHTSLGLIVGLEA